MFKRSKTKLGSEISTADWVEQQHENLDSTHEDQETEEDITLSRASCSTQLASYISAKTQTQDGMRRNLIVFEGTALDPSTLSYASYRKMLQQKAKSFQQFMEAYKTGNRGGPGVYDWLHRNHFRDLSSYQADPVMLGHWQCYITLMKAIKPESRAKYVEDEGDMRIPVDIHALPYVPLSKTHPLDMEKVKKETNVVATALMVVGNLLKNPTFKH
jgi:hypothetical protein